MNHHVNGVLKAQKDALNQIEKLKKLGLNMQDENYKKAVDEALLNKKFFEKEMGIDITDEMFDNGVEVAKKLFKI